MKALFVFLFLLITSVGYGQISVLDTSATGGEVQKYVGTAERTDMMPLPVKIMSGGLTGTLQFDSDSTLKVLITGDSTKVWDWSKYVFSAKDTVGVGKVDTLFYQIFGTQSSFSTYFTKWWAGDIIADDTIEVSLAGAFTAGRVLKILPNILTPLPKVGIAYQSNLYIRRFSISGETGVPNWIARVWGY